MNMVMCNQNNKYCVEQELTQYTSELKKIIAFLKVEFHFTEDHLMTLSKEADTQKLTISVSLLV